MTKSSSTGKLSCRWCGELATHAIRATLGSQVAYSYQCDKHKHVSSQPLGTDYALHLAWQEFQSVPSYVETQARLFAQEREVQYVHS